jgi:beta-xylosidase
MDVSHMKQGDLAGLALFQDPYAFIAVRGEADSRQLVMVNNGDTVAAVPLEDTGAEQTVYLQAIASNSTEKATFQYSMDNKTFTPLGNALAMRFNLSVFTGNKFCIFNYATRETGGYVDVDWFRVR